MTWKQRKNDNNVVTLKALLKIRTNIMMWITANCKDEPHINNTIYLVEWRWNRFFPPNEWISSIGLTIKVNNVSIENINTIMIVVWKGFMIAHVKMGKWPNSMVSHIFVSDFHLINCTPLHFCFNKLTQ